MKAKTSSSKSASKNKSANKMVESLSAFLAAYKETEEKLIEDYGAESEEEITSGLVTELASAAEVIVDSEDYSSAYIASACTSLTDALKELDPDIFEHKEEEEDEDEDEDSEESEDVDEDDYYDGR